MIGHHVVAVRCRDYNLATLHIYAKYGDGQPFGRLALLGGSVAYRYGRFERPSAPSGVCRRERDLITLSHRVPRLRSGDEEA